MKRTLRPLLLSALLGGVAFVAPAGCGEPGEAGIGTGGTGGTKPDSGTPDAGKPDSGSGSSCVPVTEFCDFLDNDCDGLIDEGLDTDGDGFLTCTGDCDNGATGVNPNATETDNNIDDNCDGRVDNQIIGQDFDGDGSPHAVDGSGDCNDDDALVGPGSIEVGGDGVDNNCNGTSDEAPPPCDPTNADAGQAALFARAMGICNGLLDAGFPAGDAGARSVRSRFGSADGGQPRQGNRLVLLSTGLAVDRIESPSYMPANANGTVGSGTNFGTSRTHPSWQPPRCGAGGGSAPLARDMTEFRVDLRAPPNAQSFKFLFNFMSSEFPEYVCTTFNDRFLVLLDRSGGTVPDGGLPDGGLFRGNISFDENLDVVSINNGFFSICDQPNHLKNNDGGAYAPCRQPASALAGTGYEVLVKDRLSDGGTRASGGGTGWLRTEAAVLPNERLTLRFIILDEGDGEWDSAVLLDGFEWGGTPVSATPQTEIIE